MNINQGKWKWCHHLPGWQVKKSFKRRHCINTLKLFWNQFVWCINLLYIITLRGTGHSIYEIYWHVSAYHRKSRHLLLFELINNIVKKKYYCSKLCWLFCKDTGKTQLMMMGDCFMMFRMNWNSTQQVLQDSPFLPSQVSYIIILHH